MYLRFYLKKSVVGVIVRYEQSSDKVSEICYPYKDHITLDDMQNKIIDDVKMHYTDQGLDFTFRHLEYIKEFFKNKHIQLSNMMEVHHD